MKLLYTKKQFQRDLVKALAPLKQENEELRDKINKKEFRFLEEKNNLEKQVEEYKGIIETEEEFIQKLNKKIDKLTEDKKLLFGAKGGLTKYVHRLENELKDVKEQLKEAEKKLSQRYILKELAPQKAKNTQVMKTKSGSKTSKIIKKVVEDE